MRHKKQQYLLAVGLGYDSSTEEAPRVVIKGDSFDADRLVKTARRFGVPVIDHPSLAEALSQVELDDEISPDLFYAVAVVLNGIDSR